MRCHLIRLGRATALERLHVTAQRVAAASLPLPPQDLQHRSWTSDDGTTAVWSWSNEGEDEPLHTPLSLSEGISVSTGYALQPLGALGAQLARDDSGEALNRAGGIWSLGAVRPDRVVVATSTAGVEPWFVAQTPDTLWLGNRALPVHLASHDRTVPILDTVALAGMVNAGYQVTDRSPYSGTRYIGAGVALTAQRDASTGRITTTSRRRDPAGTAGEDYGSAVASALTDAVTQLGEQDGPISVGLTGGRDSRLIVAALLAAGKDITTFTRGPEGHADVVVARQVADALGVPHRRVEPGLTTDTTIEVDPSRRLRNAVVACDGQLSAYDATGGGTQFSARQLGLSGAGGEILRGGFAPVVIASNKSEAGLSWLTKRVLFPMADFLSADVLAAYREDVQPWVDRVSSDPPQALADFFLHQRTARWTGAARMGSALSANARTIFLDDAVLASCRHAPVSALADESVIRDALQLLAPQLRDVPFMGRRLICDQKAPADPELRASWSARQPVPVTKSGAAAFQWRHHYGEEIAAVLRPAIDQGRAGVLRTGAGEAVLPSDGSYDAMRARLAWHAATAGSLSDPSYYDPATRHDLRSRPITVEKPH